MKLNKIKKKKAEAIPGTIVKCQSGRFLAFYEHRLDIVANGDNEDEAKRKLKKMYEAVLKFEKQTKAEPDPIKSFKTKSFSEKLPV